MTAAALAAPSPAGDKQPSKTGRRQHADISLDRRAERQLAKFVDHMPAWLTEGMSPIVTEKTYFVAQNKFVTMDDMSVQE